MAKKKTQTLEEALLPESEQPYAVPENWVWTRLGTIAQINMGQSPKGEDTTDDSSHIGLIGGASDMGHLHPDVKRYTKNPTKLSNNEDTIVSIRATLGRPIFSDGIYCLGRGVAAIRSKIYLRSLLRYLVITNEDYLIQNATGTTFAQVSGDTLYNMPTVLPPLAEQRRIVERIESLFEKLDHARELVQTALDSFETRKAAILHKAFTGELTAQWRAEHGVEMDSWEERKINSVANTQAGYAFDSKMFSLTGTQVIRMGNLFNGLLDLSRAPVFLDEKCLDETIIEKYTIKQGSILLTLTGTKYKRDYGYAVMIRESQNLLLNQRILSLYPVDVVPNFLLYYLRSDLFRDVFFSNETGGVNQGNVSSRFVESILLPFPSLPEQTEIVRILDSLLGKEQKAKEQLAPVLEQIDLMKKSILARAFRGELGTNDPSEEGALGLLEEILK